MVGSPTPYPGRYWRADTSIDAVRQFVTMTGVDTNLYVFFCHDSSYFGTVGIAYVGGLCDTYGYAVSLNEWRNTTLASGKVRKQEC